MRKGQHRVIAVEPLSEHTFSLRLERNGIGFQAGQCFNLGLPKMAVNREYSSYSGVDDTELRFLIREVEDGEVSPKLRRLKPGDLVEVDGAYGLFVIDPKRVEGTKYYFIATGTGIAPFHCFVRSFPKLDYKIIHGTRLADEDYNRADYHSGRYVQCVSSSGGADFRGRVTDYLREFRLPEGAVAYLCGNRNMINDVYDILSEQGLSGDQIITEVFF